jgi:hypothetical protein
MIIVGAFHLDAGFLFLLLGVAWYILALIYLLTLVKHTITMSVMTRNVLYIKYVNLMAYSVLLPCFL